MFNMQLDQRVVINTQNLEWQASPSPNVLRKPLARAAAEHGHATSIVEYQAGATFPNHKHPLGEEILVLEGIFSDENGDYPAGSYLRNPPGSEHQPYSESGCTLFVKLHQFLVGDQKSIAINTRQTAWLPGQGGLHVMPLHQYDVEHVALVKWPAGERFQMHQHFGGEEIFVIAGEFKDEHGSYPAGTWLRNPHMSRHFPFVEEETLIWVKTGHLPIK